MNDEPEFLEDAPPLEMDDSPLPPYQDKEWKTLRAGIYEAEIVNAGKIPNKLYNPETQDELHKQQLQFDFKIVFEGEDYPLRTWTSLSISPGGGKARVSHLWLLLEALGIDPKTFSGRPSTLIGKKLRVFVKEIEKDGKKYNRIDKENFAKL